MRVRGLVLSSCAWLALATAACAALGSQPPADSMETDSNVGARAPAGSTGETQALDPAQDSGATAPGRDLEQPRKLKMRTGGPLPPRKLPDPARPDRSCRSDADCVVKDIGNCCGSFSACVNRDSPTDPAAAMAQCAKTGSQPACDIGETSGCHCVAGNCTAQPAAAGAATSGQAAQPQGPP